MIGGQQLNMRECKNDNYIFSLFFAYCIVISSIFSVLLYFTSKSLNYINKISKWQSYFISNNNETEICEDENNDEENNKECTDEDEHCNDKVEDSENQNKENNCDHCCDCKSCCCKNKECNDDCKNEKKEITTDELINKLIEIKKSLSNLKTLNKVNMPIDDDKKEEEKFEIKPYNEDDNNDKLVENIQ